MKQYLEKIEEIVHGNLTGDVLTFEGLASSFIFNKGVNEEELFKCKGYFKDLIPDDYINFLKFYNGGVLYKVEDFAGFKFLSVNELIQCDIFQKENFSEDWNDNIVLFCEILGDNEFIGYMANENGNVELAYYIMDLLPEHWDKIEGSFEDFMSELIIEKGRKFWIR